jgi:hypothetical protein
MARKKTARKTARKKTARRSKKKSVAINWSGLKAWAVPVLAGLSILALGAGMTVGVERLDSGAREVLTSSELTIDLRSPADMGGSTWVDAENLDILSRQIKAILDGTDPFDVRPLEHVSTMLESSGWFQSAPSVERVGQSTIRISGTWRRPAAVVRSEGRDHLISWKGMPMPVNFAPGGSQAPIIIGVGLSPADPNLQARFARPWPGDDVGAALDLLRVLVRKPYYKQVAAIDVGKLSQRGPIVLVTDRETRIVWGGRPGTFNPGEVSDDQKIARLDAFFDKQGRIDGGFDRIEIQGTQVFRDRSDLDP